MYWAPLIQQYLIPYWFCFIRSISTLSCHVYRWWQSILMIQQWIHPSFPWSARSGCLSVGALSCGMAWSCSSWLVNTAMKLSLGNYWFPPRSSKIGPTLGRSNDRMSNIGTYSVHGLSHRWTITNARVIWAMEGCTCDRTATWIWKGRACLQ